MTAFLIKQRRYQQYHWSHFALALLLTCLLFILGGCENAENKWNAKIALEQQNTKADPFANEQLLTKLIDFNSPQQRHWLTAQDSQIQFIGDADDKKLAITFSAKVNKSQLRIQPQTPWDFSAYANFNMAFDVENNSPTSAQIYLSVENTDGKTQRRSVSLPPAYRGTVYFPLTGIEAQTDSGLWGDAPPWQTQDKLMVWRSWRKTDEQMNQVAALDFFTLGVLDDKTMAINNIRLRQNPPTEPDWMVAVVDKFGQNARINTPLKIHTEAELKAIAAQELSALAQSLGMPARSEFGGYTKGPKLDATGYFRTEKVNGKWWMVDPQGYLFFSHGPANVRMANMSTLTGIDFSDPSVRQKSADELTPEDSMGIVSVSDAVRSTDYVTSELRHNMFEWLPKYDDQLSEHYSYRRSTHKGPIAHGETYSFYRANLERRYGQTFPDSYIKKWQEVTLQRMKDWGFTSFGNWVDPAFYDVDKVPYFANGWIIGDYQTLSGQTNHWGLMPDPFDPVFMQRAKSTIDSVAQDVNGSPWCVGIFIDNEKSWGEREGSVEARYGVILDALSKDTQASPAKMAFSGYLKDKYSTVEHLNSAWQTSLSNWSELDSGIKLGDYSAMQIEDLSMMLTMLGEQYFKVVHDTLATALPHHLYMGARMANWGMPDEIIKASLKYSDVLSFNIYEEGMQVDFWKFLQETDLPVVVGEFHIGTATDSGLFNPGIVHATDQADRARMYKAYMQSVLEKPYMVGAHWFQYIDEPISGRAFDGENANIGFVTVTDIPYPELIQAVKEVTSTMYQQRYGK